MESDARHKECLCDGREFYVQHCLPKSLAHLHGDDCPGMRLCGTRNEEEKYLNFRLPLPLLDEPWLPTTDRWALFNARALAVLPIAAATVPPMA